VRCTTIPPDLITVHDTTPVVKVIDFGVAKVLGQELTDKTLFTGFAQLIGTPSVHLGAPRMCSTRYR
jgi:hypothetical protein